MWLTFWILYMLCISTCAIHMSDPEVQRRENMNSLECPHWTTNRLLQQFKDDEMLTKGDLLFLTSQGNKSYKPSSVGIPPIRNPVAVPSKCFTFFFHFTVENHWSSFYWYIADFRHSYDHLQKKSTLDFHNNTHKKCIKKTCS